MATIWRSEVRERGKGRGKVKERRKRRNEKRMRNLEVRGAQGKGRPGRGCKMLKVRGK